MAKITIQAGEVSVQAELDDTLTAQRILDALPLEGRAHRWGDEIYFEIPLRMELEDGARSTVAVGELGYWPAGPAFCVFFGPTPVSTDRNPKAYSPVNVFGRITGDARRLKAVTDGAPVRVTAA